MLGDRVHAPPDGDRREDAHHDPESDVTCRALGEDKAAEAEQRGPEADAEGDGVGEPALQAPALGTGQPSPVGAGEPSAGIPACVGIGSVRGHSVGSSSPA
jgi:hypothetical protein